MRLGRIRMGSATDPRRAEGLSSGCVLVERWGVVFFDSGGPDHGDVREPQLAIQCVLKGYGRFLWLYRFHGRWSSTL